MTSRWQIDLYLKTPLMLEILEPASEQGGLPKRFGSRRPCFDSPFSVKVSDGLWVNVSPFVADSEWGLTVNGSPVRASLECLGLDEPDVILRGAEPYFEEAIDYLSFIWDYPVTAYRAALVDVSKPAKSNDIRRFCDFIGYQTPKWRRSNFHGFTHIELPFDSNIGALPERVQAALRWYSLGISDQGDVQRFMSLWVALELLVQQANQAVRLPLVASCGHEIPECPICQKPTARNVGGAQIREFISREFGYDAATSKALWNTRQMVHGRNKLLSHEVSELPRRLAELMCAVRVGLARFLGATIEQMPSIPFATGMMALAGERELTDYDLDIGIRTFPLFTYPLQRIQIPPVAPTGTGSGQ